METKFVFKNFEPPQHVEHYAHLVLDRISDPFPGGRFISAHMIKMKDEYFCCISFLLGSREYLADAYSADPRVALDRLDENLSAQLVVEQMDYFDPLIDTWHRLGLGREH